MRELSGRPIREERKGARIEYALIVGLIVVVAIVLVGAAGSKALARWTGPYGPF